MSTETHLYPPPADMTKSAHVAGPAAYDQLVAEAARDYDGYWSRLAREFVTWKTPFSNRDTGITWLFSTANTTGPPLKPSPTLLSGSKPMP